MKVKAAKLGFYKNIRRRPGDVFDVASGAFSEKWMVEVDKPKPVEPEGETARGRGNPNWTKK